MKKIIYLAIIALTASCSTSKGQVSTNWLGKMVTMKSDCSENGTCTATRQFDKGLNFVESNEIIPTIVDNPQTVLIQFEFNRNKAEDNYADDFYKEEIFIQIPAESFKKSYKDSELNQVKLVYGKHCYCKGEAGYFKITEGSLTIDHSEKHTKVKLSFKAPSSSLIENIEFVVE